MESKEKGKAQKVNIIKISYKDLVRYPKNGKPEQIRPGDPEWDDGIACIKAYQAQATTLTQAQQEEMRDLIKRLDYLMCPTAVGVPQSHKLYRTTIKKFNNERQAPSWPVFIILTTLYDTLPKRYVEMVRGAYGKTILFDHTKDYLAIEGTEPAEPPEPQEEKEKPQPLQMKNSEGCSDLRESTEDNEVVISSASPSSTESEGEELELVPVSNFLNKVRSDKPTSNDPLNDQFSDSMHSREDSSMDYLADYPMYLSSVEPRYFSRDSSVRPGLAMYSQTPVPMSLSGVVPTRDVNSAQMSSNIVQKRQISPETIEGSDSPTKKRSKLTEYEPGRQRRASNIDEYYSKLATIYREKSFPTTRQSEIQELCQAVNKMNDTLGKVVEKIDTMTQKLDTMTKDAKFHRKGTRKLVAAARGEKTPSDSDNDA
ncbi:hypothetical protein GGI43DRAFT_429707 [Trichoderma evansii]